MQEVNALAVKFRTILRFIPIQLTLLLLPFCGCLKAPNSGVRVEYVLGTFCRIDLFENGNAGLYGRLFDRLAELDRILSANRDDSELALLNRNAGLEPTGVSPELSAVLERALYFAGISGGAFDPAVGPLVKLWGISTDSPRIPRNGEIGAALELVNWQDVDIMPDTGTGTADGSAGMTVGTVFLRRPGMALDLGAIAKGYAADELVRILRETEVPGALIDLGGNIYVWGNKADGKPWLVGVQDPLDSRGSYAGILELAGSISVVTSGVYERYFTGDDGKRYHHIFGLTEDEDAGMKNPRGYPVENGLLSVTVIAVSSMDADALSTSCFALGYEKGLALAAANGAEVLFIFEDKTIRGSPGAMSVFTVSNNSFRVSKSPL
ncbi:MAG: FAD:protein FMN transferase [Spirochaetaceae bacterium]|nr:FAD:protein FMN transferase [Spirochaetaceae bacterium]